MESSTSHQLFEISALKNFQNFDLWMVPWLFCNPWKKGPLGSLGGGQIPNGIQYEQLAIWNFNPQKCPKFRFMDGPLFVFFPSQLSWGRWILKFPLAIQTEYPFIFKGPLSSFNAIRGQIPNGIQYEQLPFWNFSPQKLPKWMAHCLFLTPISTKSRKADIESVWTEYPFGFNNLKCLTFFGPSLNLAVQCIYTVSAIT